MLYTGANISTILGLVISSSLCYLFLVGFQPVESVSNITNLNNTYANVTLFAVQNNTLLTENKTTDKLSEEFLSPRLVKVTDGVYSAVGFGPANIMLVETNNGLVIIDSGSSIEQAKNVLSEFRKISDKKIVALIYTSAKADHIGGGRVFVNDSAGQHVDVIAQDSFMDNYFPFIGATSRQRSMYNVFLTGLLLPKSGNERVISNGIGPSWTPGNVSFVTPNILFNDTLKVRYGDLNLTLAYAPGASDDQLAIWLPDKKVLFPGDNVYKAFPSIYSMNGKYRDMDQWLDVIDAMNEVNASFLVPSHSIPVTGSENVRNVLNSYRDGMAFVYQQTIRYINRGYGPDEIIRFLQLPSTLKANPWLQERLGEIAWQIRAIYEALVGWNIGDASFFNQVSSDERARKIVDAYGGLNQTLIKIQEAIKNGELKWGAELATYALDAHPDSEEARSIKAKALRIMGLQNPTSEGRNWYLTQANILDKKINISTVDNLPSVNIIEEILPTVPLKNLLAQMQYKLNPNRAPNGTLTVGIYLNDTQQGYTFTIRNNAVEFLDSFPREYNVALTAPTNTIKDLLLGKLKFADGIFSNKVKIDGDLKDLIRFTRSFDFRFVVPAYNNLGN